MSETPERRRVARLFVPRHLGALELVFHEIRLLDLSPAGARIEHPEPLHEGAGCTVDLPRAFGRLRVSGRVVWTRLHRREPTSEGEEHVYHQSGLVFVGITPEQEAALATALELLKTAGNRAGGKSS